MVKHFIIMGSSYETKRKIALDVVGEERVCEKEVRSIMDYLKENCLLSSISTHMIITDSPTFQSVQNHDHFFSNVSLISTKEEFVNLINKDRYLKGIDVANYIKTRISCTHLKIEKLTYLCYADYLCAYHKPLFQDKIFAYAKGPVVQSVYRKFKGIKSLLNVSEDDKKEYSNKSAYMSVRSRIMVSEDGLYKLDSINKTLEKYGHLKGQELVELTHRVDSPWVYSGSGKKKYQKITDDIILKYHCNEIL